MTSQGLWLLMGQGARAAVAAAQHNLMGIGDY
jgi:hypothetical protein